MTYPKLILFLWFQVTSVVGYTQIDTLKPSSLKMDPVYVAQTEVAELSGKLSLSEEQAKKVEAIETGFYDGYLALRNNNAFSGIDRKMKRQQLQKDKEEALAKILAPAQWTIYVRYINQRSEKVTQEIEQARFKKQKASLANGEKK